MPGLLPLLQLRARLYRLPEMGSTPVHRTFGQWRRRDSGYLVGLLVICVYLLGAIGVVVEMPFLGRAAVTIGALAFGAILVGELMFALRPSAVRLARADRIALTAGPFILGFAMVVTAVLWVAALFS